MRSALEYVLSLSEDFDDRYSLQHFIEVAKKELRVNAAIRATLVNEEQRKHWDDTFSEDDAENRQAVSLLSARLARL